MSTVFSKIISGDIPCTKIFEDERTLAFLDIGPVSFGHCLVIPKAEVARIEELSDDDATALILTLKRVAAAIQDALSCDLNIMCNNGKTAGQEVEHVHFHLIPRSQDDDLNFNWEAKEYESGKADAFASKIKDHLL